ncbi:S8 family peptidase [Persicirhabdus sediminis]|uniref:S8 family serine peptidase n=1 Tax=Persicirhabdus sediminis TaxID=454144 RepID=A0A8J7SHT9_9BACT|nr:S8 family serine peptidase [Persicirhabdus sediminis]MBK1790079.1 S8 family serine peptidase [Persicirhabdus sediminis]
MFQFDRKLILTLAAVILMLGIAVIRKAAPDEETNKVVNQARTNTTQQAQSTQSPASQPANFHAPDAAQAEIKLDEKILTFTSQEELDLFLEKIAAADQSKIRLIGVVDKLLSARVRFISIDELKKVAGDAKQDANYLVTPPPMPPAGEIQPDALGFGQDYLSWLGIEGDNSSWGSGVTVAVLDSGLSYHPAIGDNVQRIAIMPLTEGSTEHQHGTAVSSIIVGQSEITPGIAPAAELMSLRVANENGLSTAYHIAEGIITAVDSGADIINISMGTYGDSDILANAVDYAASNDVLIVAASGNNGLDHAAYPAAYPSVTSVGAIDANAQHLLFSNSDPSLDFVAPGYQLNAAWSTDKLIPFTGTSAAAPVLTSIIAATMSLYQVDAFQAQEIVSSYANDGGLAGPNEQYGNGIPAMDRVLNGNQAGRYDPAVSGYAVVEQGAANTPSLIQVNIQNRGTETLINTPISINAAGNERIVNITSLAPGEVFSYEAQVLTPADGTYLPITTTIADPEIDARLDNNSLSANILINQLEE